jgi:hypothetical protein
VSDRIALFGEVGVEYNLEALSNTKRLALTTAPLGILLYLN